MARKKALTKKIKFFLSSLLADPVFRISLIIVISIFFSMVAILMVEKDQNSGVNTLFDSFWYTIVTITTVGYGDIYPSTFIGRLIGLFTMAFGVIIFAAVTGKIASFLIDLQLKRGRGLLKLQNLKDHFVICGWKPDFERIIDGVLETNLHLERSEIVLINNASSDYMEAFLMNPKYKMMNYISGDFIEESVLIRANIKTASKILFLADYSQNNSILEIDSRTILAVLTVDNLNRNIYKTAELLDEKLENHLSVANCDEIILSKEYERKLIVGASSGTGISHVVSDLLSYDNDKGLFIKDIPKSFIGDTFDSLFSYFYEKYSLITIGVLENTGNFYQRKKEALNEAQKTPDISMIVSNLKKVKELKANSSVLSPGKNYIVQQHSKAIIIGEHKV